MASEVAKWLNFQGDVLILKWYKCKCLVVFNIYSSFIGGL